MPGAGPSHRLRNTGATGKPVRTYLFNCNFCELAKREALDLPFAEFPVGQGYPATVPVPVTYSKTGYLYPSRPDTKTVRHTYLLGADRITNP